ncbi:hypothetical protein K438DRAFT_1767791 [Mycena galopus ATCC 62051]|nr:hypothetical protein K438DRAFT_1767791 [Mycena galopus ATCC 62051]
MNWQCGGRKRGRAVPGKSWDWTRHALRLWWVVTTGGWAHWKRGGMERSRQRRIQGKTSERRVLDAGLLKAMHFSNRKADDDETGLPGSERQPFTGKKERVNEFVSFSTAVAVCGHLNLSGEAEWKPSAIDAVKSLRNAKKPQAASTTIAERTPSLLKLAQTSGGAWARMGLVKQAPCQFENREDKNHISPLAQRVTVLNPLEVQHCITKVVKDELSRELGNDQVRGYAAMFRRRLAAVVLIATIMHKKCAIIATQARFPVAIARCLETKGFLRETVCPAIEVHRFAFGIVKLVADGGIPIELSDLLALHKELDAGGRSRSQSASGMFWKFGRDSENEGRGVLGRGPWTVHHLPLHVVKAFPAPRECFGVIRCLDLSAV